MLRFPNAKINLGLFITEKRTDGYHNLETVFYPVQVKDALEIIPSEELKLITTGNAIEGDLQNNLIWKAFQLLQKDFPETVTPLEIYLHKLIPMGAGLGGGSADGAFMLQMLRSFFKLNISDAQLEVYALQLGSDCPFFIQNKPVFASGRGEIMSPIELDLRNYTIQLICPKLHISTALAFQGIQPKLPHFNLKNIVNLPIAQWKDHVKNDFEISLFPHFKDLESIKNQLYEQGALYASLSGTGSTVFGIFKRNNKANIQLDIPFESFIV